MKRRRAPRRVTPPGAADSWAALAVAGARHLCLALVLLASPAAAQSGNFPGDAAVTLATLTNTAQAIKGTLGTASPGEVRRAICSNPNASTTEWLQFFDTTSAIVVGTTTPKFAAPVQPGVQALDLDVRFLSIPSVAAASSPAGGTAPASALQCAFTYR